MPTHCRAHLEYVNAWFGSTKEKKMYAISDSGADATIVGSAAKVVSYTSCKAVISGYDPESTKSDQVPIVTALLKVQPPNAKGYPVLLCIHEAPYLKDSPITLLSEYQIQENGLVIDSVAKKHKIGKDIHGRNIFGTQQFYLNDVLSMPFEDRGALMGFEILPFEQGDEERYDIITITADKPWSP